MEHEHLIRLYYIIQLLHLWSLTCSVVNTVLSEHQHLPWQPLSTVALCCYIPLRAAAPASLCCLPATGRPSMREYWPELPLGLLVSAWSQHAPPGCPSAPGQPSHAFQEPWLLDCKLCCSFL